MKPIGILGGGQLSKLLAFKAKALGLKAYVLSTDENDPAAQGNPFWIKGDPHKSKDLKCFFQKTDWITFESEFFPAKLIEKTLQSLKGKKPYIAPSLKALSLIQDRRTQKQLLSQCRINTADFVKVNLKAQKQKTLLQLWKKMGPFVLKSRMGGYDGCGTFVIRTKNQIKTFPPGSFIAEKFVPFQRELALLSARNKNGQIVFFPLVESFQKDFRCLWVKGPAKHKKLNSLKKQIKHMLNRIDYQGLIAFELFDTGENLLVNELAPRVHNSGHYSLDALNTDQFTSHLKAITNQPLTQPKPLTKGFAMLNLLGEGCPKPFLKSFGQNPLVQSDKKNKKPHFYLKADFEKPVLKINKQIRLYWYGKTVSRKGRKMGHINSAGSSANQALNQLLKVRKLFKV